MIDKQEKEIKEEYTSTTKVATKVFIGLFLTFVVVTLLSITPNNNDETYETNTQEESMF